ncbi:MAG: hypothetical protein Q8M76_10435, partial [Spirochaetaceae bacterium]|nr:hypothetical protein [Spirochaetaceae bacterium]
VPERGAALVRTDARGIAASLTELPSVADGVDWYASSVLERGTVLGLAPGDRRLLVRDSAPGSSRIVALGYSVFEVMETSRLELGSRLLAAVGALEAIAFRLPAGGTSLALNLEKGLVAFSAGERTERTFSAESGSAAFVADLRGSLLYIVNPGREEALASLLPMPFALGSAPGAEPSVADGSAYESALPEAVRLTLRVEGSNPASVLAVAGSVGACRFYDSESGFIFEGEPRSGRAGDYLEFPGRKGKLEIEARPGWVRAWLGRSSDAARDFADLGSGGAPVRISESADARALSGKTPGLFSLRVAAAAGGLLTVKASGPGVLALLDERGAAIAVAAGEASQDILLPVEPGSYVIGARPFKGSERNGSLLVSLSPPIVVSGSGQGETRILG